ncbi:PFL_4695 family integrating conjugative element protein [Enterovibrio norvegicus]|uniref:PFL_4695 family integrating conjugative element protein n=1 Tax=Enterovibrio norvegicus TaxID=188144 RepID=UPI000C84EC11|nr:integrating conjugative element protein [Enterovibrio norvegicus]PMH64560.1 hypothetical protein BCU62_16015 [Enterovibrio norvegicus]
MKHLNKEAFFKASFLFLAAMVVPSMLSATIITNTQIATTQYDSAAPTEQQADYNKPVLSEMDLQLAVTEETERLNRLLQETTATILQRPKGRANLKVLKRNVSASQPLVDIIGADAEWEAEKRRRELSERAQLDRFRKGQLTEKEMRMYSLRSVFPVKTAMQPTRLPSRKIDIPDSLAQSIHQPIAVIGSDAYSMAWFKANINTLKKFNVGIIVTEVETPTDFDAIRTFAPNLQYQPLDAKDFLQTLGVSVYPILISSEGAIQ